MRTSVEAEQAIHRGHKGPGRGLRALMLADIVATFALITLGGVVRVTESGLGCPDWPLCHGRIIPPAEYHVLIEYTHRLVASLVGVLVFLSAAGVWWRARNNRPVLVPLTLAVPLVGVAAWLGRNAVLSELSPATVTVHLATAQVIFALLVVALTWSRHAPAHEGWTGVGIATAGADRRFHGWAVAAIAATFIILLSGSYAVGKGAGTSCPAWPLCDGGLLPDFEMAWVHMGHRVVAGAAGLLLAWVAHLGWRRRTGDAALGRASLLVGGLLIAQTLAGAANPWLDFATAARAIHLSLATALWGSVVALAALALRPGAVGLFGDTSTARRVVRDYITLTKPRIILLLLVTALGGMFLANEGPPPLSLALLVMAGGALGAGGAQAINHSLDRDIDRLMRRTMHRPVAGARVRPRDAMAFGILLNAAAFVVLAGWVNLLSALLTLSATLFYVLVYTSWLKRSTTQNIVIGGAAGAVPPMVGWAAVTGGLALPPLYLFAIIFFWTPPHFWALSLLLKNDYARAGVPMLPVVKGELATAKEIMLYTLVLVALTILFFTIDSVGLVYISGAVILGTLFLIMAWRLLRTGGTQGIRPLYLYSLLYLAGIFALVMVDSAVQL